MIALAVGLALVRLIHLGADTPPEVSSSAGLYVDEGYKTLSPRNLLLFGTTHWHPKDAYSGWMSTSPVTSWAYYASFRMFGANIEAARGVTVLFFALFLVGFAVAMSRRYSLGLIVAGLVLLGFESILFFLSRVALLEIPIVTFLYGLLFVFARTKPRSAATPFLLTFGASLFLVLGVKISALLYLGPVLLAVSTFLVLEKSRHHSYVKRRYVIVISLAVLVLLVLTREAWLSRMEIGPLEIGRQIFDNPLVRGAPVPILAGVLCAVHVLVCRPELIFRNVYRLSLVAIVLLGLPSIAIFDYNPLRYYVPLLPAYLLLVLEWVHLRGWEFPAPRKSIPTMLASVVFMMPWIYYILGFLLMRQSVWFSGGELSFFEVAVVLTLALVVWWFRSFTLRGKVVATTLLLLLASFLIQNTRSVGSFLIRPTFQAQKIRSDLMQLLPDDAIVAGVWAPFLMMGTPYRVLYQAAIANPALRLPELAPDYILQAEGNRNSRITRKTIRVNRGIWIGESVYSGSYHRTGVNLHRLRFDANSDAPARRGPFYIGRDLVRRGKPAQAEPLLREALGDLLQESDIDPAWIADIRSELGACLVQLRRYAEAEELLYQAYQTYGPAGEAPAQVMARLTLNRLIELYLALDWPDEVARHRQLLEEQQ